MKTKEEIEAIIAEIAEVCDKHGVVLVGTCNSEGIYSEISFYEASYSSQNPRFAHPSAYEVRKFDDEYEFQVRIIGSFTDKHKEV